MTEPTSGVGDKRLLWRLCLNPANTGHALFPKSGRSWYLDTNIQYTARAYKIAKKLTGCEGEAIGKIAAAFVLAASLVVTCAITSLAL